MLNNPGTEAQFARASTAPDSGPDLRRFDRYRVELELSMGSEHNFYAGFVENMSQGGLFIATHTKKNVGERVDFTVHLPGFAEPVSGVGEVRWVRVFSDTSNVPPGIGVRFLELRGNSLATIESFLKDREPLFYDE
jgi:uncharacterized protein (TIGR02266 family)